MSAYNGDMSLRPEVRIDKNGKRVTRHVKGAVVPATGRIVPPVSNRKGYISIGEYSVKDYSHLGGEETEKFTATIYRGETPVMSVRNDGRGGSNMYAPVNPEVNFRAEHDAFSRFASTLHPDLNSGAEDLLIGYARDLDKLLSSNEGDAAYRVEKYIELHNEAYSLVPALQIGESTKSLLMSNVSA